MSARDLIRFSKSCRPCAQPTRAKPGSEEKILILSNRRSCNLPLFHPDDNNETEKMPFMSNLQFDDDDEEEEFDIGGEG